ncbi:GONST4 [Symbiodinium pilosum]|uniref:GONST4 protein n=1 Tax=Symbiodinium pilosum TaxID=2952 RepID=A0A812W232_SYMPI|nr:GONST4 [Symbiodinium pilosum]
MSDELSAANAQMSSEQELATTAAVGAEEMASSACPSSSKICHRRTDSAVPAAASEAAEGGVPDAEKTPSSRMASATSQAQLQCDPPGVEGQNTATCSPSGSPQKSDSSPATVVAPDDVSLPAASPDPSASDPGAKAENERVLRALRQDALGVLQSLAVVKRKLLAASSAPAEPSSSAGDGTPALKDPVSPEHGQDDDSTSTAMDSGTSRSSGAGHTLHGDGGTRVPQPEEQKFVSIAVQQEGQKLS